MKKSIVEELGLAEEYNNWKRRVTKFEEGNRVRALQNLFYWSSKNDRHEVIRKGEIGVIYKRTQQDCCIGIEGKKFDIESKRLEDYFELVS